jgi:hypothetical protein
VLAALETKSYGVEGGARPKPLSLAEPPYLEPSGVDRFEGSVGKFIQRVNNRRRSILRPQYVMS